LSLLAFSCLVFPNSFLWFSIQKSVSNLDFSHMMCYEPFFIFYEAGFRCGIFCWVSFVGFHFLALFYWLVDLSVGKFVGGYNWDWRGVGQPDISGDKERLYPQTIIGDKERLYPKFIIGDKEYSIQPNLILHISSMV